MKKLPISDYKDKILEAVKDNSVVIITAETGAGKSTQVPQYLLEAGYNIVVTQPRRLAARTVAQRVAFERGEDLGGVVGFRTAYERKDSRATRCLFVTDGLALVRELMGHGNHTILVLDEVHEWNLNIDVLVAWSKRQIEASANFKVVVMSATLESEKLSDFFNHAPTINVPGRLYPVVEKKPGFTLLEDVAYLLQQGRNVLVFQPGKKEIGETIEKLVERGISAEILPLHGEMQAEEQAEVFAHYARPKCVVSTNVAQTSVTIDDIDAVVDSGSERRVELFEGVEGLYLKPISLADREQRKGRAGRTRDGIYIDCCESVWNERPEFPKAEILRTRLDQTVLRLAQTGIDAEDLDFFHQPPRDQIHEAKRALRAIGCLKADGSVTAIGRRVARLPVSVQYGRMIVEAERLKVVDDVITVAAILEQGEITIRPKDHYELPAWRKLVPNERESDVMAQLAIYKAAEKMSNEDKKKSGIFVKAFYQAKQKRQHLVNSLRQKIRFGSTGKREDILKAVCAGMVDHLFRYQYGYWDSGDSVFRQLNRGSVVAEAEWVVGLPWDLQIKTRRGKTTLRLIRMPSKVTPEWLVEVAPQFVTQEKGSCPVYDVNKDCVVSNTRILFNGRVISEKPEADPNHSEAAGIFARWLSLQQFLSDIPAHEVGKILNEVLLANAKRQERARVLNSRMRIAMFHVYSDFEIEKHYLKALAGAKSIQEVVCPKNLLLPALDEEKLSQVISQQPDKIKVLGEELTVEYTQPTMGRLFTPSVRLTPEMVESNRWLELPDKGIRLPNGQLVEVFVNFNYWNTISGVDLAELKRRALARSNQMKWGSWADKPEVPFPDLTDSESVIPFVVAKYGTCAVTGKDLVAYGTCDAHDYLYSPRWPYFDVYWTTDIVQANNVANEAARNLEKIRKLAQRKELEAEVEKRRKVREDRSLENMHRLKKEMETVENHRKFSKLPWDLKHHIQHDAPPLPFDPLDDREKWVTKTEVIIRKAKKVLCELENQTVNQKPTRPDDLESAMAALRAKFNK